MYTTTCRSSLIRFVTTISLFVFLFVLPDLAKAQDLEKVFSGAKPFGISGSLSARSVVYHAANIPARRKTFSYILSGNATATLYGAIAVPFSFTYSNQNFYLSQPFNQFGLSPTYKWITVHGGFRNINHSSYTLAGHQMVGGGFDLTPGKFRLGFMYGRLQRAVQEDTTLQALRTPAYKRTGWSAKIGYGTVSNFIDLIVFKAKDDEQSLNEQPALADVLPGENLVIGINTRQTLFNDLTFYFDGALSYYVRDKTSPIVEEEIPSRLKPIEKFITLNATTQAFSAFKTGINYHFKFLSLSSYFQHIDPDYRSMGIYFVNNDIQVLNVAPSVNLLQNTLQLKPSVSFQRDNLQNKKTATTKRILPQLSVHYQPNSTWGIEGTYTNMATLQQAGALPLDNALKMDQTNPIYTLTANYNITDTIRSHSFNLFANRSELIDNNLLTQSFADYVGSSLNLSYNYTHFASGLGLFGSFNANNIQTFNGNLPGTGFSLGGNKSWQESDFSLNANLSLAFQEGTDSQSVVLGGRYQLGQHNFSVSMNYLNTIFNEENFSEFTGFIEYSISFK